LKSANQAVSKIFKTIFGGQASGQRVHTIEEQRLDTLGDDFDEGSDLSKRDFVVPNTPGAVQGGSRNLL